MKTYLKFNEIKELILFCLKLVFKESIMKLEYILYT